MFTGIVEELGRFVSAAPAGDTTRLRFAATAVAADARVGDSIAVNGCCLTVVELLEDGFAADAVEETLRRTNLGHLGEDEEVNLERSVAVGDRLGGHLVQGHVDTVGVVAVAAPHLSIEIPSSVAPYLVEKGSVAVDGCSLTVVVATPTRLGIEIIPHTAQATTIGRKGRGALVNLEVDVVAKYVERLVRAGVPSPYEAIGQDR